MFPPETWGAAPRVEENWKGCLMRNESHGSLIY